MTTITKSQKQTATRHIKVNGKNGRIVVNVRHDDNCNNGHNTFAITGEVWSSPNSNADRYMDRFGCIHDDVARYFPDYAPLIKWHLVSTDGPMHYIANTTYWASRHGIEANALDHARSTAFWPDATDAQLLAPREELEAALRARLPALLLEFRVAVESLGLVY